jgi:hypothetical protein
MSLQFADGFAQYGTDAYNDLSGMWVGFGSDNVLTDGRRPNTKAIQMGAWPSLRLPWVDGAADRTNFVAGFAYYWSASVHRPGGPIFGAYQDNVERIRITTESNGQLDVFVNGTKVGETDVLIYPQRWHYIEVMADQTSGNVSVQIDGCPAGTFTGVGAVSYDELRWGNPNDNLALGGVVKATDFYAATVDGSGVSGFQGDVEQVPLWVAADDAVQFTPSLAGHNYTMVDDGQTGGVPDGTGPDGDATYNASETDTDQDLFTVLPTGLPTDTAVLGLTLVAQARKTDIGNRSLQLQVKSGAATRDGAAQFLSENYRYYYEAVDASDPTVGGLFASLAAAEAISIGYKNGSP